jgi:hypothetical protein
LDRRSSRTSREVNIAFIKESYLREMAKNYKLKNFAKSYIVKSKLQAKITIFLSHSHKDKKIAVGFQNILAQSGVFVYIDWQDSTLPVKPNRKTAEKIKEKIRNLGLFILLATNYALSSKWCPWEIGIADSFKGYESILIVPIVDALNEFRGSEYLQLYRRIEIDSLNKIFILEPSFKNFEYSANFYENEIIQQGQREALNEFLKRKARL